MGYKTVWFVQYLKFNLQISFSEMNLEEVNKKLDMMARQQEAFLDRVFSHGLHMAQPQPVGVKSITDI